MISIICDSLEVWIDQYWYNDW